MSHKINITLAVTVIIIVGVFSAITYFSNRENSQTKNIPGQKLSIDMEQPVEPLQQIKTMDEINTPLASSSNAILEIAFDNCGNIDKYKDESWYYNFTKVLSNSSISISDIREACFSFDKTTLIAITEGGYCEAGLLFQYKVSRNVLDKAVFDDHERGCVSWPDEFGKRNGKIISLQGFGGDAGCSGTMYYEYNYIDNKIELKKECGECEGEKQIACTNY